MKILDYDGGGGVNLLSLFRRGDTVLSWLNISTVAITVKGDSVAVTVRGIVSWHTLIVYCHKCLINRVGSHRSDINCIHLIYAIIVCLDCPNLLSSCTMWTWDLFTCTSSATLTIMVGEPTWSHHSFFLTQDSYKELTRIGFSWSLMGEKCDLFREGHFDCF